MPWVGEMTQTLRKLLRGEIAAVETYEDALRGRPATEPGVGTLERITRDHVEAVEILQAHLEAEGEEPDSGSGRWGAYARFLQRVGEQVGEDMGLKALKEGEVHGLDEYRTALGHDDLPQELRRIIEERLLPRQQEHVQTLDMILKLREREQHGA